MCPEVGSIKRSRQRPTVDLPQPDSPTRPSVSPAKISNDTPSTARTTSVEPSTGKCLTRPLTLTSVSLINPFVVGCDCGSKIVKHATHFNVAVELIQRNLFRRATRHTMRTARREVTTGRQIRRSRHDAFDRLEPLFLYHLRARELWDRTQQALRVRMLGPCKQLVDGRLFHDSSR